MNELNKDVLPVNHFTHLNDFFFWGFPIENLFRLSDLQFSSFVPIFVMGLLNFHICDKSVIEPIIKIIFKVNKTFA